MVDDGDDDHSMHSLDNDFANSNSTLTILGAGGNTANATATLANSDSKPSTKRGRKVALTAKDVDSQIMIIDENSSTSLHDVSNSSQSNKNSINNNKNKKRRRKNQTNQSNQETTSKEEGRNVNTAASTSDEDEECSALDCIRPSGEPFIRYLFCLFVSDSNGL